MQIDTQKDDVIIPSFFTQQKLGINIGPKLYKTLMDSLYANKPLACIREVISNAYDANKANKNIVKRIPQVTPSLYDTKPYYANPDDVFVGSNNIEVTLPTKDYPYFIVSDNGTGLTIDEILGHPIQGYPNTAIDENFHIHELPLPKNLKVNILSEAVLQDGNYVYKYPNGDIIRTGGIYTTFFKSSKDKSNDQIGHFGLGTKSPYAVSDSFTVISRQNGYKHEYLMFINSDNEPCVTHITKNKPHLTNEFNGLTVKVPINYNDIDSFTEDKIYNTFIADGVSILNIKSEDFTQMSIDDYDFTYTDPETNIQIAVNNYFEINYHYCSGVVVGNVLYKDAYIDIPSEILNNNNKVLVKVPIGSVIMSAGRENIELSDSLQEKISDIFEHVLDSVIPELLQSKFENSLATAKNISDIFNFKNSMKYMINLCRILDKNNFYNHSNTSDDIFENAVNNLLSKKINTVFLRKFKSFYLDRNCWGHVLDYSRGIPYQFILRNTFLISSRNYTSKIKHMYANREYDKHCMLDLKNGFYLYPQRTGKTLIIYAYKQKISKPKFRQLIKDVFNMDSSIQNVLIIHIDKHDNEDMYEFNFNTQKNLYKLGVTGDLKSFNVEYFNRIIKNSLVDMSNTIVKSYKEVNKEILNTQRVSNKKGVTQKVKTYKNLDLLYIDYSQDYPSIEDKLNSVELYNLDIYHNKKGKTFEYKKSSALRSNSKYLNKKYIFTSFPIEIVTQLFNILYRFRNTIIVEDYSELDIFNKFTDLILIDPTKYYFDTKDYYIVKTEDKYLKDLTNTNSLLLNSDNVYNLDEIINDFVNSIKQLSYIYDFKKYYIHDIKKLLLCASNALKTYDSALNTLKISDNNIKYSVERRKNKIQKIKTNIEAELVNVNNSFGFSPDLFDETINRDFYLVCEDMLKSLTLTIELFKILNFKYFSIKVSMLKSHIENIKYLNFSLNNLIKLYGLEIYWKYDDYRTIQNNFTDIDSNVVNFKDMFKSIISHDIQKYVKYLLKKTFKQFN